MKSTRSLPYFTLTLLAATALSARAALALGTPGTIDEFPIPTSGSQPLEITQGPDGALWFTESGGNKIGRISVTGQITEFTVPTSASQPAGIIKGADGNMWFTELSASKVAKISTDGLGTITEFPTLTANSQPAIISVGPHGGLWFAEMAGGNIGTIDPLTNVVREFPIPSPGSQPIAIRPGSDGALWFTEAGTNKIGKIVTGTGVITEFTNPDSAAAVRFIAPAPDGKLLFTEAQTDQISAIDTGGNFKSEANPPTNNGPGLGDIDLGPDGVDWFVEQKANKIGRVSANGFNNNSVVFQEFPIPTPSSTPQTVSGGPDGNLWFTEKDGNKIGRLNLPASSIPASPVVAAVLPGSRSIQSGATATAFATIINGGSTALTQCQIIPLTDIPITFNYQTTNSATNAPTGSPNAPVSLAASGTTGSSQSFVISATANTAFVPTDVILSFNCKGPDPALPVTGVNTLLLSSSASPVPDVIALGATATGDGELHIPGSSAVGAFAVATANVGATGAITATADTGSSTQPVILNICQTDPVSGVCTNPTSPGPSATVTINTNATPTFAIFANSTGSIPFAPATSRIFVRFKDAGGVVRGATSVAVRTN